jgi:glycosyltransferase involved in cell wall biosynthesis
MAIISVIIPAYNAEKTIIDTVNSVLKQTFLDWELIVINDGSTDRTLKLLLGVNDARLKVYSYPNGGLSLARNRGINLAKGEYISFLDADDLWTPDKLELQLAALKNHPEAGLAYSWIYSMDEKGESFFPGHSVYLSGNVYAQLLVNNFIVNGSNCLVLRQAIESVGEFDPSMDGTADWDYWLRLAAGWQFVLVPKFQIFYRASSSAMSTNVEYMEQCILKTIEKAFQAAPLEMQSLKIQSLPNSYRYLAYKYWTLTKGQDKLQKTAEKLWKAIRLYPAILKEKRVRNLFLKVGLIYMLTPKIGYSLISFIQESRQKFLFKIQ